MASQTQHHIRSVTTMITTITTTLLLLLATTLAASTSSGVPLGCHLHPQENLVSCRAVDAAVLRDFLLQLTINTTISTTTPPPPPQYNTNTTPPLQDNSTTTTTSLPHTTTITTKGSGDDVGGRAKSGTRSSSVHGEESLAVRELSCVGCRIPRLSRGILDDTTSSLAAVTIVDSKVQEVSPDALASHALTLVRLDLSHNLLQEVPEAVANLTRLEVLDLSHNGIIRLALGMVFSRLRNLRHLHLDHNELEQTVVAGGDESTRSRPLQFDLEGVQATLTHLTLAHNGLTDLPKGLTSKGDLQRLSRLDLSQNNITEVPPGSLSHLVSLQHLDLSSNLLTSITQDALATSLLELDLRGNPWNCSCESKWILERHTHASVNPTVTSPTCSSPPHLRHKRLDSFTVHEVCHPAGSVSENQVVYIGDDVDGPLEEALASIRLLNATALTSHALLVSWRIDASFYSLAEPLSWAVTVRVAVEDPREAQVTRMRLDRYRKERPQWTPGDSVFAEVLQGLEADTAYVVCLTPVQQRRFYTRPDNCLEAATLPTASDTPSPDDMSSVVAPAALLNARAPKTTPFYSTDDYIIQTKAVSISRESRSVDLSWNVTVRPHKGHSELLIQSKAPKLRPLGWRISYRRFGQDEEEEVILVSRGGEPIQNFTNHYTIGSLQPGTGYLFCFHMLTEEEVRESLAENDSKEVVHDVSPPRSSPLSSRGHSQVFHSSSGRGRSVVDPREDNPHLNTYNNILPATLPPPRLTTTAPPAPSTPVSRPALFPHGDAPPITAEGSSSFLPSFQPQSPSVSSSSFPSVPPSFSPFPSNRPPRPPGPQSGGGFVYTSTGKRIPLPTTSTGFMPPFSAPPPIALHQSMTSQGSPSPSPPGSRQRYIYEFDDTSADLPPPPLHSPQPDDAANTDISQRQIYTYQTRRRRAAEEEVVLRREVLASGAAQYCWEVVTMTELEVVLPAAIAATVSSASTVVVVLLVCCCCWPRRCCRRKGGWRTRAVHDPRKISTISAPSPVNVFSGHTSVVTGSVAGQGEGNLLDTAPSTRETPGGQEKAARSISVTSSSGYLTPLQAPNGVIHDAPNNNSDPQRAYLALMQSRLMQTHKDLPEFHPGYDIPPTASKKKLFGYDYPHPTPVNPIGGTGDRLRPAARSPPLLPSPTSSDSNYNVSIGSSQEPGRSPTEVNLNIPLLRPKSSDLDKNMDYNYITPEEVPTTTAARTYLKHPPPSRNRHRKFGQPHRGSEEHSSVLEALSRSTPDLATAANAHTGQGVTSAPLSLIIRDSHAQPASYPARENASYGPASLPPTSTKESRGYANLSPHFGGSEASKQEGPAGSSGREREMYHTWSSTRTQPTKPRPNAGEVVLTGGTLIEVPEGYVIPKAPTFVPSVKLLVRGDEAPKDSPKAEVIQPEKTGNSHEEERRGGHDSSSTELKNELTHLLTPEMDQNRLVINTALSL